MPEIKIKPAELADIPALCQLLNQLFSQEREFVPDESAQTRGLNKIISEPGIGQILVARNAQHIVGMVSLLYTVSTALGERVALLEDMVINAEQRGNGLGSQLMEAAISLARQQGCRRITLLTDQDNEVAQRFYQKQGFTVSTMLPLRMILETNAH